MWDAAGASWQDGDDDRMARIAAGESTDPQLRVLQRLSLDMDDRQLAVAAFWLDQCDEAGYHQAPLAQLQLLASAQFDIAADGWKPSASSCCMASPQAWPPRTCAKPAGATAQPARVVPARHLAARILDGALEALAAHDYPALARPHDAEIDDVREAVRLILSLPAPGRQPAARTQRGGGAGRRRLARRRAVEGRPEPGHQPPRVDQQPVRTGAGRNQRRRPGAARDAAGGAGSAVACRCATTPCCVRRG